MTEDGWKPLGVGDVLDKVHRKELPAMRWGQQFRWSRPLTWCMGDTASGDVTAAEAGHAVGWMVAGDFRKLRASSSSHR